MTGKREMKTNESMSMTKILARSMACGAATTGATIFGTSLIGTGFTKIVSGIKERRAGRIVTGILTVGIGGVVFAGSNIITGIVTDKTVDDLMELEQSIAEEEAAIETTEEDPDKSYSSIDWSKLTMSGRKIQTVEPGDTAE